MRNLFSIPRPDLERTSLSAVHNTTEGVRVTLTDGGTLDADLLVGADVVYSTMRGLVFGEERRYLRYSASTLPRSLRRPADPRRGPRARRSTLAATSSSS